MRQHPARAMYDRIDDTLTSITMQLRAAIQADVDVAGRASERCALQAGGVYMRESISHRRTF
jgi:hypothetical protein